MVVATSPRGEFAVMADHAPLLATLSGGALRVQTADGAHVFACRAGTLRVAEGQVAVLVESATPVEDIDIVVVRDRLAAISAESTDTAPAHNEEREHLLVLEHVKEKHG